MPVHVSMGPDFFDALTDFGEALVLFPFQMRDLSSVSVSAALHGAAYFTDNRLLRLSLFLQLFDFPD